MSNEHGREDVNVVATAVRIAGGPKRVAEILCISRSQVYRWINARTMENATYIYVAKLARLSGIQAQFLGGDGSSIPVENPLFEKARGRETVMNTEFDHRKSVRRQMKLRSNRVMEPIRNHAIRAREVVDD
jgi:hypothetical protein